MNLKKMLCDVFHPEISDIVLIVTDIPSEAVGDNAEWLDRRRMAQEWHTSFEQLSKDIGFSLLPLVSYESSGLYHADPVLTQGSPLTLGDSLPTATLIISFAEYSITSFLLNWTKKHDDVRVASLPLVSKRMEKTALDANYLEIKKRCNVLAELMIPAIGAEVLFSTGHKWFVDLRFRNVIVDDGQLPRDKKGERIINLPSGEVCMTPYEGEKGGLPSKTQGEVPFLYKGELVVATVENNIIKDICGDSKHVGELKKYFAEDVARANIAEFAFGCNPNAVIWGNVLEDEKVGFHWAYGRSDFLGGIVSPSKFKSPGNVTHNDIVYAKDTPIGISSIDLLYDNGSKKKIISDREYVVF